MRGVRLDWVIARVLAIVLPLGLLGWGYVQVAGSRTKDAQRQFENAGQLLNGEVLKVPVTRAIAKRMANDPRMIVLGNSFANTNVMIGQLNGRLGLGRRNAARLSIPNTIAAHWYVVLKHRVFIEPYEPPDLVILLADLQSTLLTEPLSEGSYNTLFALLDPKMSPDPVVERLVDRRASFVWDTIQDNRTSLRQDAIHTVRDASARVVLGGRGKGRKATNDALDRVFHASRIDPTLKSTAMPVTVGQEATQIDLSQIPDPAEGFLPEIARLCHENGAMLVILRNKESPLMPPGRGDIVPDPLVQKTRDVLRPFGAVLVEMEPIEMVSAHYDNLDHMTEEGSKRFTEAIAEVLLDIGATEERERYVRAPVPASEPPLGPVDTEASESPVSAGSLAGIASIRRSWRVVRPDKPLTWTWDEPWPLQPGGDHTFRVRALFEGGRPEIRIDGRAVGPARQMTSGRWMIEHEGPPPTGPWSLTVSAGSPTVIEGLELGTGPNPRYLVGYRPDIRGHHLELLGRVEVFDGQVWRERVEPQFQTEAPQFPPFRRKLKSGPGPSAFYPTPELAQLSDMTTRTFTPFRARCSPVRIRDDGEPLPRHNIGCKEVSELGNGRMCHTDRRVFVTSIDGSPPMRNRHSYTPFLAPDRDCDGGFWMYPGDIAVLDVPSERLRELRDGADRILIDVGFVDVALNFELRVDLDVNGQTVQSFALQEDGMRASPTMVLDRPIAPTDTVRLRVVNPDDESWVIVNRLGLLAPDIGWSSDGSASLR